MLILKHTSELRNQLDKKCRQGRSIGFIPTMGALHAGHVSLVKTAKKQGDFTVVSIFVNPLQFNNQADFDTYPVRPELDVALLIHINANILFLPGIEEVYPGNEQKEVHYDLGHLDQLLEGNFRPGHFQGVCRVMDRLLNMVSPEKLYLGQKDFQQVMVISRMIHILKLDIKLIVVPTMRESNGLAMSSRNLKLSAQQRGDAAEIYKQLQHIRSEAESESFPRLRAESIRQLERKGLEVEYLELANARDLSVMGDFDPKQAMVLLTAVYAGDVRLIDNLIF